MVGRPRCRSSILACPRPSTRQPAGGNRVRCCCSERIICLSGQKRFFIAVAKPFVKPGFVRARSKKGTFGKNPLREERFFQGKTPYFHFSVGNICVFYERTLKKFSRVRGILAPLIFISEEIVATLTVCRTYNRAMKKGYFQKSIGLCLQGLTSKVGKSSLPKKANNKPGKN